MEVPASPSGSISEHPRTPGPSAAQAEVAEAETEAPAEVVATGAATSADAACPPASATPAPAMLPRAIAAHAHRRSASSPDNPLVDAHSEFTALVERKGAEAFGMTLNPVGRISALEPGSSAEAAGLQCYDRISRVDGVPVDDAEQLTQAAFWQGVRRQLRRRRTRRRRR